MRPVDAVTALSDWSARRWWAAVAAAIAIAFAIGIPTDVIPNPVFGRPLVDVQWWNYPVLVATAILGGLLLATYVAQPADAGADSIDHATDDIDDIDAPGRAGGLGGLLSFFAVGCPTCNKVVVLAIGTSGALDWFAPAQPMLALLSVALIAWALRVRLRGEVACRIAAGSRRDANMVG